MMKSKPPTAKLKKILSAPNNVIDAYIHIGCFNEDVVFDKTIESTDQKYKQGLIQLKKGSNR